MPDLTIKKNTSTDTVHVMHVNTGSCNGCDIEVLRLVLHGTEFVNSPSKADAFIFTGPMNTQIKSEVDKLISKIPSKKTLLLIGSCALSGGICQNNAEIERTFMNRPLISVFGCPPSARQILKGIKMSKKLKSDE
jgi:Ni,Fe-hydrogenase III small subunit